MFWITIVYTYHGKLRAKIRVSFSAAPLMVLILDGSSEHVAHVCRKVSFCLKISLMFYTFTFTDHITCLTATVRNYIWSTTFNISIMAHQFLQQKLKIGTFSPCSDHFGVCIWTFLDRAADTDPGILVGSVSGFIKSSDTYPAFLIGRFRNLHIVAWPGPKIANFSFDIYWPNNNISKMWIFFNNFYH